MVNLVLFGPPGSGKGTQGALLQKMYNMEHIAPGNIFRAEVQKKTPLGLELQSYIDKGDLVPEDLTIQIIGAKIGAKAKDKNLLLDGYPRSLAQAKSIESHLQSVGKNLDLVLFLEVDHQELKSRIALRGKKDNRVDDRDESILAHRLSVYENMTLPVARYYEEQKKLVRINGLGTVDEVQERIIHAIENHLPNVSF